MHLKELKLLLRDGMGDVAWRDLEGGKVGPFRQGLGSGIGLILILVLGPRGGLDMRVP